MIPAALPPVPRIGLQLCIGRAGYGCTGQNLHGRVCCALWIEVCLNDHAVRRHHGTLQIGVQSHQRPSFAQRQFKVRSVIRSNDGETHEYTAMCPGLRKTAETEGNAAAVAGMTGQISESRVHAALFKASLEKARKRFAALAKVEERQANHYKAQLAKVMVKVSTECAPMNTDRLAA